MSWKSNQIKQMTIVSTRVRFKLTRQHWEVKSLQRESDDPSKQRIEPDTLFSKKKKLKHWKWILNQQLEYLIYHYANQELEEILLVEDLIKEEEYLKNNYVDWILWILSNILYDLNQ